MDHDREISRRGVLHCGPVTRSIPRTGQLLTRTACNRLRRPIPEPASTPLLAGMLPRNGERMRPSTAPIVLHWVPRGARATMSPQAHRQAQRYSL